LGYGFIMGYYISPNYRRRGFGREMFAHILQVFRAHGAEFIYLSPDPVTGEPFWSAMGFKNTGKMDPDDKLPIYIKDIRKDS
ncbi:MAG: GNAT family N-acetyltransferase, partial [Dehalococcoidales bacterium]|nr:GNAT family N-acetyltransferase [Dehalococcoidales bacterium]